MFNKISNTPTPPSGAAPRPSAPPFPEQVAQQPAPQQRPAAARVASVLGPDLVFEGSITGEGELLVDGAVKGDIHVARLIIGEHAHVEGTVRGGSIEVRGRVIGNVEGKAVRLLQTAHVEGDVTHEQLSIDVGAFFQGRCAQFRPVAQQVPQQAAPQAPQAQVIELDPAAQRQG